MDQDLFKLSTVLDPNFGISAFEMPMHAEIKQLLKKHMKSLDSETATIEDVSTVKPVEHKTNSYLFYNTPTVNQSEKVESFDFNLFTDA